MLKSKKKSSNSKKLSADLAFHYIHCTALHCFVHQSCPANNAEECLTNFFGPWCALELESTSNLVYTNFGISCRKKNLNLVATYLVFQNSSRVSANKNPVVINIMSDCETNPRRDWCSWLGLTSWFSSSEFVTGDWAFDDDCTGSTGVFYW